MKAARTGRYYARELRRRLAHYAAVRRHGYRDHGSLEAAAETILATRTRRGLEAGGHFRGVWPRDLGFAARGLVTAGFERVVADTADWIVDQLEDVFYTDLHDRYNAATPREGADTFPAVVLALDACDRLPAHADAIADLAERHRERFVGDGGVVTGVGSSWWDSAAHPRETYNTATLLAAAERLESAGVETTFTGASETITGRPLLAALERGVLRRAPSLPSRRALVPASRQGRHRRSRLVDPRV